jgi:predicted Zn-dependent protease
MISTTADYLAQCSWWTSNNEITEADINFNPAYSWSSNPTSGQYDIQSVFTHELGHALGLGHSSNSSAVMQATIGDGVKRRTISNDDILGIEDIY